MASLTGTGTFDILGAFPFAASGQSDAYTLELYWPSDTNIDIGYAGEHFGTTVGISAVASQAPLDGGDPGEEPEEPAASDFRVVYQTDAPWTEGAYWDPVTQSLTGGTQKHGFSITIYNLTAEDVTWQQVEFTLNESIYHYWDTTKAYGSGSGAYGFNSMSYNNIIPAGQSVTIAGQAIGNALNPVSGVRVNGQSAQAVTVYYSH